MRAERRVELASAMEMEEAKRNRAIATNNEEVVRPMVKSEVAAGARAFAEM
jgi:hypothetical protein